MSGVMKPFDTLFGVVINRLSSRRALMLPSFDATYPRAYMRRPASTMSARTCSSTRLLMTFRPACGRRPWRSTGQWAQTSDSGPLELGSALLGAEVMRRAAGGQRTRRARRHVGAAYRIADQLHSRRLGAP